MNFIDILLNQSVKKPDSIAYTYLEDGENIEINISFSHLCEEAKKIAAYLQSVCKKGDRVLLFFPHGIDFIKAYFGCLFAGVIAVPSYPPKMNRSIERLNAILKNCEARVILSNATININKIRKFLASTESFVIQLIENIDDGITNSWVYPELKDDDIAFLQYTSGSTGIPKGVMVSHKNLVENEKVISQSFKLNEQSIVVGWLPFYHDMGLIGNILQPVYSGFRAVLMSPIHFLQDPFRWMTAITKYKATVSGGPNFSYDLCVERITDEQLKKLDLSSWKVAFNGAEPVRAKTLEYFAKKFTSCGFNKKSFMPCYGMAETTLMISGNEYQKVPTYRKYSLNQLSVNANGSLAKGGINLVSCGKPHFYKVKIVNEQKNSLPEDKVGEIWVQGESVAKGYWNRPLETKECFDAYLNDGEGPFFRTGDMGLLKKGEILVTGRLKDLIIINGRNYYPQDIEDSVTESHTKCINGSCAVFSIETEENEKLIVVCEVNNPEKEEISTILQSIKEKVFTDFSLQIYKIALIRRGTILKTTSGKIQRKACKEAFLDKTLNIVHESECNTLDNISIETEEIEYSTDEKTILDIINKLVEKNHVKLSDNLFGLGFDSIKIAHLSMLLSEELDVEVSVELIFENPVISQLTKKITELDKSERESVPSIEKAEYYKLSPSQLAIWFDQQFKKESNSYNIPIVYKLNSKFNFSKFEQAFKYLISKYEVFKTSFHLINDLPVQKISDFSNAELGYLEFNDDNEKDFNDYIKNIVREIIALDKPPLFRANIIKNKSNEYYFIWVIHHIITDGNSIKLLLNELIDAYEYLLTDNYRLESNFTNPFQYKDYAGWINAKLNSGYFKNSKQFWRDQFKGELPVANLPYDYSIDNNQSHIGATCFFKIEKELKDRITELAANENSSTYMVLLCAYILMLNKITGQDDIIVGSPAINRDFSEFKELPGLFLNTLLIRNKVDGKLTFKEFLAAVRKTTTNSLSNRGYPFFKIIEDLNIKTEPGKFPVSSFFFNGLNFIDKKDASLIFDLFKADMGLDINFDLNLYFAESEHEIILRFDYKKALFKSDTIEAFILKFKQIIEKACAIPDQLLLNVTTQTDTSAVKVEISDAGWYSKYNNITGLLNDRFERFEEKTAIETDNFKISYAELDSITNFMAHNLLSLKEKTEHSYAGIFVGHNQNLAIAVVSSLKSGLIYVPIDSQLPEKRIKLIVEETKLKIILTDNANAEKIKAVAGNDIEILIIDNLNTCDIPTTEKLNISINGNDPAYIMFTSGSTGKPKGVIHNHRNVLHYISNYSGALEITENDKHTGFSSIGYDSFNNDFYGSIFNGATYCPKSLKDFNTEESLFDWITNHEISIMHITPVAFRHFADHWTTNEMHADKLRIIKMTGESVRKEDFSLFKKITSKNAKFVVSLGSTEATLLTINAFTHEDIVDKSTIPVGYPVKRTKIKIWDNNFQELDILEPGEIVIESEFVTDGYINDDFSNNRSFSKNGKLISYKTGDIGRILTNGKIEWLGRKDFQIKVRGVRIELGEIECTMLNIDGIKEIVVNALDRNGDKNLVAYYVADKKIDQEKIRNYLIDVLPDYMVPDYYFQLTNIPLLPNGKVNRIALPLPDSTAIQHILPKNTTEEILLSIWSEVLKIEKEKISTHTNFFELGGHSLKAIKVISKIQKQLNADISLVEFFKYPSIAKLSDLIQKKDKISVACIKQAEPKEYYPLSSAQRRLFILQMFDKSNLTYNLPVALSLEGNIDEYKIGKIFVKLFERHEGLRTAIIEVNGEYYQKIIENIDFEIERYDSGDTPEKEIIEKFIRPFNLEKAPLFRVSLIKRNTNNHLLLIDMHHIISDGTSMGLLIKDFISLYNGEEKTPLSIQYKDYCEWLLTNNYQLKLNKQGEYWKQQFQESIPIISLPVDYARPGAQSFEGEKIHFELNTGLTTRIKQYAQKEGLTIYMVLFSVYSILLSKLSRQSDLVIGTPVAGRNNEDTEHIIGMFVNTLPVRIKLDENLTYNEYVREIKSVILNSLKNQDYPYEQLVEEIVKNREMSRNPLFDVMFIFQNTDIPEIELPEMNIRQYDLENSTSKFDLTLQGQEIKDRLALHFEYCTRLFKKQTIERFKNYFLNLLNSLIINPELQLDKIDFLPCDEKTFLLENLNLTEEAYPKEKTIQKLFEEQVEKTPDETAIIFQGQELSYQSLNTKANQLANYLIENGVKKDEIVALMVNRSNEMMIGLLGILKSGGAYLPVDPDFPEERIRYMLENSEAKIIISEEEFKTKTSSLPIQFVDIKNDEIYRKDTKNPVKSSSPENLAYVIYTSGSTGKPKGIMVEHRNVLNFITGVTSKIPFSAGKTLLSLTTISFDIFVLETLLSLSKGLRVAIGDREEQNDPLKMAQNIKSNKVDMLQLTPSRLRIILGSENVKEAFADIKEIMIGGEAFPEDLLKELKKVYNGSIFNMYGPTETTVWSTIKNLTDEENVTIGEPIANTQVYILDKNNILQPLGVAGELCIGGESVTRGYWKMEGLTNEKFMNNPYKTNCRIYRTGDLARYNADGALEFLGRLDHQLKIRGYRIEPGEIEEQLRQHPDVEETVVVARKEQGDENVLYAYLVTLEDIAVGSIRNFLSGRLPDYMIPSHYIKIDSIPLTPNKKTDINALIKLGKQLETGTEYKEPENEIEIMLTDIWKELLNKDKIGINDNFFELGGNSLKIIQMNSILKKKFNKDIPVVVLFRYPTIHTLSNHLITLGDDSDFYAEKAAKAEQFRTGREKLRQRLNKRLENKHINYGE